MRVDVVAVALRRTLRRLARDPAYVAAVVMTIAITITLNVVAFRFLEGLILRPLPYRAPGELVALQDSRRVGEGHFLSADEVRIVGASATTLSSVAAYRAGMARRELVHLTSVGSDVAGVAVSAATFSLLGVHALIGRALQPSDSLEQRTAPVVISYDVWRRFFRGDASVLGDELTVDGRSYTLVGVMPPGFWFPFEEVGFWIPFSPDATVPASLSLIGRLRPGASAAAAERELREIGSRLDHDRLPSAQRWWRAGTLDDARRASDGAVFFAIQAIVMLSLLIACANVGALATTRMLRRREEAALRSALGASPLRTIAAFSLDVLLLVAAASALGLLAGSALVDMLVSAITEASTRALILAWHPGSASVALASLLLAVTVFATTLAPVLHLQRIEPKETLQEGAAMVGRRGHRRIRRALVIGQIALSIILGAVSLQFYSASRAQSGLVQRRAPDDVFVATIRSAQAATGASVDVTSGLNVLMASSAVRDAAASALLAGASGVVEGPSGELQPCRCVEVTAHWPAVTSEHLVRGRSLNDEDERTGGVVLDEVMAAALFDGVDPIGRTVAIGRRREGRVSAPIVGIVSADDAPEATGRRRVGRLLMAGRLHDATTVTFAVRSAAGSLGAASMRHLLKPLDQSRADPQVRSLRQLAEEKAQPARRLAVAVVAVALGALLTAFVGLSALVGQSVEERAAEIGLRLSLGESDLSAAWSCVRDAVVAAAYGIGVGLLGATAAVRVMRMTVPGLPTPSASLFLLGLIAMAGAVAVSAGVPAFRVLRKAPMQLLGR